jgi:lysophospholipase L1-like esterase
MLSCVTLLLALFAAVAAAQDLSCPSIPTGELDPGSPLNYPMMSDRYAVSYSLNGGGSTGAPVYISYYGLTHASPWLPFSNYILEAKNAAGVETAAGTSMSFVSIPVPGPGVQIVITVTKLWGSSFQNPSVRPNSKSIGASLMPDGTITISTQTPTPFDGEQFVLWWNGVTGSGEGGQIQGLVFFLNPVYSAPSAASNVLTVNSPTDLTGIPTNVDTLEINKTIQVATTGDAAFVVPSQIRTIYLGPNAWLQGKLRFQENGSGCAADGTGCVRTVYGPGVLDVSLFHYNDRHCGAGTGLQDEGYPAISFEPPPANSPGIRDQYLFDGIMISDTNFYATDLLDNATVNNVKTLGWNGNNDGLEIGTMTNVSNVFVRSGDDSVKMWGSYANVKNATVWQNYNGGVVNLGWFDNSPGENSLIDGLNVVDTDWFKPTPPDGSPIPIWRADPAHSIDDLNNAVVASEMVPGTLFGLLKPSLYRNIFVEETDLLQVLFSLKIAPPRTGNLTLTADVNLKTPSVLNLNIENLQTPQSLVNNLIGFQTLPAGYSFPGDPNDPSDPTQNFPTAFTMTGSMDIGLYGVEVTPPGGFPTLLTNAVVANSVGKVQPNGAGLEIDYGHDLPSPSGPQWYSAWTAPQGYDIVPPTSMNGNSVRMIVRPTASGHSVRVKIENTVGQSAVAFSDAYFGDLLDTPAGSPPGAALKSNTQLTFNGSTTLTLNPGDGAYSDPLPFTVHAFRLYAVSLDVQTAQDISGHLLGMVTNYMAYGAHASDTSGRAFMTIPNSPDPNKGMTYPVYWVAAMDVDTASSKGGIVTLGDSITDGQCSNNLDNSFNDVTPDVYQRWTDLLAMRLGGSMAVANEGIAGNKVAGGVSTAVGEPALVRIANDVLNREGTTHVIYLEGTNDIAAGVQANQLIAADERLVNDAHIIGLNIIGATILPRGGESLTNWSMADETQRQLLNQWIRTSGYFDGVIDFDALMSGGPNPATGIPILATNYSCYDNVHPNPAGYSRMASYIDLSLFNTPLRQR